MEALLRWRNAPQLCLAMTLAGFAVFGFAISQLMLGPSEVLGDRLAELTCLQVAFTPERYSSVFLSFSAAAQAAIRNLLVPGDVVFAWGYGLQLAGLTGLLALRLPQPWRRVGAIVMWAPLLASALDCVEDVFLYTMAGQLIDNPAATIAPALPLLAGIAATLKYAALALITPTYGLAGIAVGLSVDRRVTSLLLYAIFGLLLVSMILRPAQQIPPCF
ncbi:MAG: hypothetical protein HKN56_03590 [Gammaproteobacteria bacterium]|nr:hypothetical protein [Gammaproteobacteria bacterium]NND54040.1 hypothetical protein [Gammaproteobacteria bacterium]